MKKYFEKYGRVEDVEIKKDLVTKVSRGFGFVLFKKPRHVDKVLKERSHELDGTKIDPKKVNPFRQAQKSNSEEENKLFIGGINPDTNEKTIREYFGKYGTITKYERPTFPGTGKSRGFCFIYFRSLKGIIETLSAGQYHVVDGSTCECKHPVTTSKQEIKLKKATAAAYQTGYGGYADNEGYPTATTASYDESLYTGYGGYGGALEGYGGYTDNEPSYSNGSGGKAKGSMKKNKTAYSPY